MQHKYEHYCFWCRDETEWEYDSGHYYFIDICLKCGKDYVPEQYPRVETHLVYL